jgi:hypothetical protein
LAVEGITFSVLGRASYEQSVSAVRGPSTAAVQ